jgi:hypothetical protein
MTDVIANLFVDVHPSYGKITVFLNGNCFSIESTDSGYSISQMLLKVLTDGSTGSPGDALYDRCSSRLHLAFHGI